MAPDLPPPIRGGVNFASLRETRLEKTSGVADTRKMFYLQDGIYVVRPCDPLRLGHVLWGKLAFCGFTHRLLIRCGKLPEVDPRAILVGMRTSLNSLPRKSICLTGIVAALASDGEAQAFRFYARQVGMVGAAKLLLRAVTQDDLLARTVRKSIDVAIQAVVSSDRGLTRTEVEKIRADAYRHFRVGSGSQVPVWNALASAELSPQRVEQLRLAADAPLDTSSGPDTSAIHEKVSQLSAASVMATNTDALRRTLIIDAKLPKNIAEARALLAQHLREAETAPEMSASVMTPNQLEAFARRVADIQRIKLLKKCWNIDEALARRILKAAQAKEQHEIVFSSTATAHEAAAWSNIRTHSGGGGAHA